MDRLTKVMQCNDGNKLYDYSNEVVKNVKDFSSRLELMFEKLAMYEDLEEQGRLVKLPCKDGDDVYYILGIPNETPCTIDKCTFKLSDINKIGKTLFLSKSEAEAKLAKKLKGGNYER